MSFKIFIKYTPLHNAKNITEILYTHINMCVLHEKYNANILK